MKEDKLPVGTRMGKEPFLEFLMKEGLTADEASRAYTAVTKFFKHCIENGLTVYFHTVCKIEAYVTPPRSGWDGIRKTMIYYGEQVRHRFEKLGRP